MRSTYFAFMFGVIIGATFAFTNTNSPLTWFHNSRRHKWKKIIFVNIWTASMGALMYFLDINGNSIFERYGINSYYIKIALSFLFTFVAVGFIPEYIFNSFEERHHHSVFGMGSTLFEFSPNSLPSGGKNKFPKPKLLDNQD